MKVKVVFLLSFWACALLVSCAMATPGQAGNSEETEVSEEASQNALVWGADPIPLVLSDVTADVDDDDDDTFARRRRFMGAVHSKYPGSSRRFRSRPRIHVSRHRTGSRGGARHDFRPY
ncbi:hypothetical protein ACOMHN_015466 [Nucella lapillus]